MTPPTPASGKISTVSFTAIGVKEASGNTKIDFKETANLTGTFTGIADVVGTIILHLTGNFTVQLRATFTGTVDGKSGTLVFLVEGNGEGGAPGGTIQGQMVIQSGTDELANLHGQASFEGRAGVEVNYSGQIHFD